MLHFKNKIGCATACSSNSFSAHSRYQVYQGNTHLSRTRLLKFVEEKRKGRREVERGEGGGGDEEVGREGVGGRGLDY